MASKYAIIEESGSQRKVVEGDVIYVDLIEGGLGGVGSKVSYDKVLMLGGSSSATIGQPYVAGASVSAEIVEPVVKGEKIRIFKYKAKKMERKRQGHRQRYTKIKITGITGG